MEAKDRGWDMDRPKWELEEWQRDCFLIAKFLDQSLGVIVNRWKIGGEAELSKMWAEVRAKDREFIDNLLRS
jgi:hypothetical protein